MTVTELLCAAMMKAILNLQEKKVPSRRRRRPVKVLVPVNLRGLFPSRSLRNFAQYVTPEADPRLGEYSLDEALQYRASPHGIGGHPRRI